MIYPYVFDPDVFVFRRVVNFDNGDGTAEFLYKTKKFVHLQHRKRQLQEKKKLLKEEKKALKKTRKALWLKDVRKMAADGEKEEWEDVGSWGTCEEGEWALVVQKHLGGS